MSRSSRHRSPVDSLPNRRVLAFLVRAIHHLVASTDRAGGQRCAEFPLEEKEVDDLLVA